MQHLEALRGHRGVRRGCGEGGAGGDQAQAGGRRLGGSHLRLQRVQATRPGRAGHGGHRRAHRETRRYVNGARRHGHQPILRAVQGQGYRLDHQDVDDRGDHQHVAQRPEHVDVHGSSVQRRRHRQAAPVGGEAVQKHRQAVREDGQGCRGHSERRRGLLRQQDDDGGVTGAHRAARAVPEGSHRLSGHQAGDVPALLFRL